MVVVLVPQITPNRMMNTTMSAKTITPDVSPIVLRSRVGEGLGNVVVTDWLVELVVGTKVVSLRLREVDARVDELINKKIIPAIPTRNTFCSHFIISSITWDEIEAKKGLHLPDEALFKAERAGFEPANPCRLHAFQACALSQLRDLSKG